MRQRMMAKLLAAAVGAAVMAGSAEAQQPALAPMPAAPVVQPAPPQVAPAYPVAAPAAVQPAGGCSTCGSAAAAADCGQTGKKHGGGLKGLGMGAGTALPIGCSCHAAEKTFVFGSCRQFFNPGNTCGPNGTGCGLFGKQGCPPVIYGPGGAGGSSNCNGPFTYLNR